MKHINKYITFGILSLLSSHVKALNLYMDTMRLSQPGPVSVAFYAAQSPNSMLAVTQVTSYTSSPYQILYFGSSVNIPVGTSFYAEITGSNGTRYRTANLLALSGGGVSGGGKNSDPTWIHGEAFPGAPYAMNIGTGQFVDFQTGTASAFTYPVNGGTSQTAAFVRSGVLLSNTTVSVGLAPGSSVQLKAGTTASFWHIQGQTLQGVATANVTAVLRSGTLLSNQSVNYSSTNAISLKANSVIECAAVLQSYTGAYEEANPATGHGLTTGMINGFVSSGLPAGPVSITTQFGSSPQVTINWSNVDSAGADYPLNFQREISAAGSVNGWGSSGMLGVANQVLPIDYTASANCKGLRPMVMSPYLGANASQRKLAIDGGAYIVAGSSLPTKPIQSYIRVAPGTTLPVTATRSTNLYAPATVTYPAEALVQFGPWVNMNLTWAGSAQNRGRYIVQYVDLNNRFMYLFGGGGYTVSQ